MLYVGFLLAVAPAGSLGAIATIAGFLGQYASWLDLLLHFRLQYFGFFILLAVFFTASRRWHFAAGSSLFALINFAVIIPFYVGGNGQPAAPRRSYRAMLINAGAERGDAKAVVKAIQEYSPDVILLEEIDDR